MLAGRFYAFVLLAVLLVYTGCSGNDQLTPPNPQDNGRTPAQVIAEIELAEQPSGVDSALYEMLRAGLIDAIANRGASKIVAAPPTDDSSAAPLQYAMGNLNWRYYCTGDYNQNGLVEVADLTPLGQNYNVAGPFEPTSALSVVDGNSDGLIAVTDITPIGQNYGNQVSAYNVYGSDLEDDYPDNAADDNGGATLVDTVDFSTGIKNPGERIVFSYTPTAPFAYYWVRPTDGAADGTPSTLATAGTPTVEVTPQVVHEDLGMGASGNLLMVDGHPALLLTPHPDGGEGELQFQRALDDQGEDWGNPVTLATPFDGWMKPSMAIIGGNPAVTYQQDSDLYFVRADDAQGSSWGTPVVVDDSYAKNGEYNVLREINGSPAVCYICADPVDQILVYKQADDALGAAWSSAGTELYTMSGGARTNMLSFETVDGLPALAYTFEDLDISGTDYRGIGYLAANDADGSTWEAPVIVDTIPSAETGYLRKVSLVDLAGIPGVGYYMEVYTDETQSISWFCCAEDSLGTVWGEPDVIFGPGHSSAEAGDQLKYLTVFPIVIPEGTVIGVVPMIHNADGDNAGELWCAPVDPAGGLDWSEDSVLVANFLENKATSSLGINWLIDGKQAACASYSRTDALTTAGSLYVYMLLLSCGYDESYTITLTYMLRWNIQLQMIAAMLLAGG